MEETTETIEEKLKKQEDLVKNLEESYAQTPSDDLKLQLNRERDTLYHLTNSLFGVPEYRAASIAEAAREIALGQAIQSAPEED